MIKKVNLYLILSVMFFVSCNTSGSKEYDTRAIKSLDDLTATIGKLSSCSYTLNTYISEANGDETTTENDVYLRGPNKMHIETNGTKGQKSFWYNGETFAYFSYNKSQYDIIKAPDNILKVLDSIHNKYGIDFPAADFLYPTLTDDILEHFDQVHYMGVEDINDTKAIALEASNEDQILQLWIEEASHLPIKMVLASKTDKNKYYEAVFSNWRVDPKLPDMMFEFQPPVNSTQVKFQPKK